jgi:putative transferase (TIGR04331 family)
MVARYLITTADRQSWRTDQPILFLGEWCKLYSEKEKWENLDSETVPYHWDNRAQLYRDYCYLKGLQKRLLERFGEALNCFHSVDHSLHYWEIVIRPWLNYFTEMLFDRWTMLHKSVTNYEITGTTVLDLNPESMIPQNMADFDDFYISDKWNHFIYGEIIKTWSGFPVSLLQSTQNERKKVPRKENSYRVRIKSKLRPFINYLRGKNQRNNEYFFISSYLPRLAQMKLERKLGQWPSAIFSPELPNTQVDLSRRHKFNINIVGENNFESFLAKILPRQIPILYLEGYRNALEQLKKIGWPRKPKVIFTATSYSSDDFFKMWCAQKVEEGSKYVISQHGGHYGTGKWASHEDHQKLCSFFFSWGWVSPSQPNVIPLSAGKLLATKKKLKTDPNGGLLQATATVPRYSYSLISMPVSSQIIEYIEEQVLFAKNLKSDIRKKLTVRLYPIEYGWAQKKRWEALIDDVSFDSNEHSMYQSINRSRLFMGTYNATTFLETFAANVPTVLFWNPKYWELNEQAQIEYDMLRSVGILFDTPETAAEHVNLIWDDVGGWWSQSGIQEARRRFCHNYARTDPNWIEEWADALRKVSES